MEVWFTWFSFSILDVLKMLGKSKNIYPQRWFNGDESHDRKHIINLNKKTQVQAAASNWFNW